MVEKIQSLLEKQGYLKIESNVPFVNLYVRYELSSAKVVQVLDLVEDITVTTEQYEVFCEKSKEHIREHGYEDIDFLTLIVTQFVSESRKYVLSDTHCWIINSETGSLLVYENQPEDFYGLREQIETQIVPSVKGPDVIYETTPAGMYTGYYDDNPRQARSSAREFTPVNTALVIINVLVFVYMSFFCSPERAETILYYGAMYAPGIIEHGQIYRLFTCMFLHNGFDHIAGNMVVLMFLGDNVERAVGKLKYILIYIFGGLIGGCGSFLYALYNPQIMSVGASGAIFAVIGALLWIVVRNKGRLEDMTTLRVCVLIAYMLYQGFVAERVDNAAHLFGLLGGFAAALVLYRKNDRSMLT